MPKKADDLQKHTLNFFKGDFDRLHALFPQVEPSKMIRTILRDFIERHEGAAHANIPQVAKKVEVKL